MVRFKNGKEQAIHATKIKRDPLKVRKARMFDLLGMELNEEGRQVLMEVDDEDEIVNMGIEEMEGKGILSGLMDENEREDDILEGEEELVEGT